MRSGSFPQTTQHILQWTTGCIDKFHFRVQETLEVQIVRTLSPSYSKSLDLTSRLRKKADEPAFKPRAVKKVSTKEGAYRDRATERRLGKESDYAQIEALAEDFEKRAAAENTDKTQVRGAERFTPELAP